MVRLPRNEKQTHRLSSRLQMRPSGLTLAMTLTLNFQCRIGYISAKNGAIATKQKANISIDLTTSNMTIGFDLGHDLDLEFSRSNAELVISLPKMVRLPQNEMQTHQLNSRPQMWPSNLTLALTLTLNFQGQIWNLLYLNQKWSDCHKKSKLINLNSRPQMW